MNIITLIWGITQLQLTDLKIILVSNKIYTIQVYPVEDGCLSYRIAINSMAVIGYSSSSHLEKTVSNVVLATELTICVGTS